MKIKQITEQEFNNFAKNYPLYSVYQTVEYAKSMENQGFLQLIVGLTDNNNNNIVGASILLIQKHLAYNYAYAPRGFLIDYYDFNLLKTFTYELKKYLSSLDIVAVKFNPLIIKQIHNLKTKTKEDNLKYKEIYINLQKLGFYHYGYNFYFEALKPRYEGVLELNKSYYKLFKDIKKSYRTKIRSSINNGVKIHRGGLEELKYLYSHSKENYKRDLTYFEDLYKNFNKKNMFQFYYTKLDTTAFLKRTQQQYYKIEKENTILNNLILTNPKADNKKLISKKINSDQVFDNIKKKLILATNFLEKNPEGIILASIIIITYQETVYLIMDAYDKKHSNFNAKHLLIWKLIEKYTNLGFKYFNLGGMSNPELKENKYEGLNQFKANFNVKVIEYAGDFELIINRPKYFMYRKSLPIEKILKKEERN